MIMKKIILLLSICVLSLSANAQNDTKIETLKKEFLTKKFLCV
jgi:hypothetical protein